MTQQQLDDYHAHGYLHLKGVVPSRVLGTITSILERWVDSMAARWKNGGLIDDTRDGSKFSRRLIELWEAAERPKYSRSPRAEIVGCDLYRVFTDEALLDIAEDLLGTAEISLHSIFNARPKCPDQRWTDTPWHQDAQYKGISARNHVPTFWIPLQRVTEHNSCLGVSPDFAGGKLFEGYEDETGFLGISPEERKALPQVAVPMEAGDLLCFTSLTPHHAYRNSSDKVRWSLDMRYEATADVDHAGEYLGFVARSRKDPASVESCEQWLAKGWAGREW